jgi:hypothetical protein
LTNGEIRTQGSEESETRDARTQARHASERSIREARHQPQTGDRDWLVGSAQVWREGPTQTIVETLVEPKSLVTTITRLALTVGTP